MSPRMARSLLDDLYHPLSADSRNKHIDAMRGVVIRATAVFEIGSTKRGNLALAFTQSDWLWYVRVWMSHFKSYVLRFFIMVLLVCSVACGEFPELSKLSDDTSNDFTTPACAFQDAATAVADQVTAAVPAPALRVTPNQESRKVSPLTLVSRGSRDFLVLYSILRT